jgi:serine/threonine protein kinase
MVGTPKYSAPETMLKGIQVRKCFQYLVSYFRQYASCFYFLFSLQYGVLADIYSLSIILFELFSGTDPFPGSMGQIWQAKIQNEKPEIPSKFPALLKELVLTGWSKKPRERPEIEKIRLALNIMEKEEEEKSFRGITPTTMTGFPFIMIVIGQNTFVGKVY